MLSARGRDMAKDFDRKALEQIQREADKRAGWLANSPDENEAMDSQVFRALADDIADFLSNAREER